MPTPPLEVAVPVVRPKQRSWLAGEADRIEPVSTYFSQHQGKIQGNLILETPSGDMLIALSNCPEPFTGLLVP
jgi:hypothetical protein